MIKEFIDRPPIHNFWQNIDNLANLVERDWGALTMIVHPTWQRPAVKYTKRYYQELLKVSEYHGPKVLMFDDLEDIEFDALPKTEMYGIKTVNIADAKPEIGWYSFISAIHKIKPKSINLVGQNINFWYNIPDKSITREVNDFNSKNRLLLDALGANDKIVYPVQCLGSLWMLLDKEFPNIQINLTKSIHPLLFIDFEERSNNYPADFNILKD